MTTSLTISRAATSPRLAAHPKASLRAEDGYTLTLRWAPRGVELGGWGVRWAALDRPGRKPLVERTGDGLATATHEVLLGDPDHQVDVEPYLSALRRLAAGGQRVTLVNLSPQEAGPWRIDDLRVSASLRQHGTNRITRAIVSLSLVEATTFNSRLSVVPRYTRVTIPREFLYTVKRGDSLKKIAYAYYHDPYAWGYIAQRNKLKTTTLRTGQRLWMPVIRL